MLVTDISDQFDVDLPLNELKQILETEFGAAREDTMRIHHPGYGDEGVDLFWFEPSLYIHIRGERGGPFRVNPSTKDVDARTRVRKIREQISVNPTNILREFVKDYTDKEYVKKLDLWMTLLAFVGGLVPGVVGYYIAPFLISLSYILLWGVLFAIYRFGMSRDSIDIRLFSIATGLFLLFGAVVVAGFGGAIVIMQYASDYLFYLIAILYVFVIFAIWLSSKPKKIYTTQWNLLLKSDIDFSDSWGMFNAEEAASLLIPASGLTALILGLIESIVVLSAFPDLFGLFTFNIMLTISILLTVLIAIQVHGLRWLLKNVARRLIYWIPDIFAEYPEIVRNVANEVRRQAIARGRAE